MKIIKDFACNDRYICYNVINYGGNMKRLTLTVDEEMHKAIKIESARHNKTIKEYVTSVLALEIQEATICRRKSKKK